jgi:DNA-directed RNA polymerase specialized sigma subunit
VVEEEPSWLARARAGDPETMKSIQEYLNTNFLKEFTARAGRVVDLEDLLSAATLRLFEAVKKMEPGVDLDRYARAVMRNWINEEKRNAARCSPLLSSPLLSKQRSRSGLDPAFEDLEIQDLLEILEARLTAKEWELAGYLIERRPPEEIQALLRVTPVAFRLRKWRLERKVDRILREIKEHRKRGRGPRSGG